MEKEKALTTASPEIVQMIRVNHAGEYGAKRIYAGQLSMLKGKPAYKVVHEMQQQELAHLHYFEQEIVARGVRPTALTPLWHIGGWVLGAVTAAMGEKTAMACTVAVESAITEHYAAQQRSLAEMPEEEALCAHISQFQKEEMEHHDTGLAHHAARAPAYGLLYHAIRGITHTAIALSKRV